jgi:GNAT superfamily N-acetyltransferase
VCEAANFIIGKISGYLATMYLIKRFDVAQTREHASALIELLADCVNSGASIGFLRPLDSRLARDYWNEILASVDRGTRVLLAAFVGDALVGSAQLDLCLKQNGRHRAEVQKVLVFTRYRRKGIAAALMQAIEREAAAAARTLLFLDTEQKSAGEPFYESLQWQRVGSIPGYALSADGVPTPNIIYYKNI